MNSVKSYVYIYICIYFFLFFVCVYLATSSQSGPLRLESRNTASISDLIFKRAKVSWRGHLLPAHELLILSPSSSSKPPSFPFSSAEVASIIMTSPPSCAATASPEEVSMAVVSPSCIERERERERDVPT